MNTPAETQTTAQTGGNAANTPLSTSATAEPRFSAAETGTQTVNANAQNTAAVQGNTSVSQNTATDNAPNADIDSPTVQNTPQTHSTRSNAPDTSAASADVETRAGTDFQAFTKAGKPKAVTNKVNEIYDSYKPDIPKTEVRTALKDIYSDMSKALIESKSQDEMTQYLTSATNKALEL